MQSFEANNSLLNKSSTTKIKQIIGGVILPTQFTLNVSQTTTKTTTLFSDDLNATPAE